MIKNFLLVILLGTMMCGLMGCNQNISGPQMTMTTMNSKVTLKLAGVGKVIIDWGDGTNNKGTLGKDDWYWYKHSYSGSSTHTITIAGENVTGLVFSADKLTNLDVSNNNVLEKLDCFRNQLTSLDVSKNIELKSLVCHENQLTVLDLSKNIKFEWLQCDHNQLIRLDVSKNKELKSLYCWSNQLTILDVGNNPELKDLSCFGNQLTRLDVSKNSKLKDLSCGYNLLTNLDVKHNEILVQLDCSGNKLTSTALNTLFGSLHSNEVEEYLSVVSKTISIDDNPGTKGCNRSIAEKKRWKFE
jgi:Leucine-rich repeat (LRR) protein